MTRILMTTDTLGGVWTYALDLARALAPHDVHFILATLGSPPTPDQLAEAQSIPNLDLVSSSFKLEWMDNPWPDVDAAGQWLLELEHRHHPDRIHLNGYAHAVLPFHAPILVVAHSCVLSWWLAVKREPAPARYNEYRRRVTTGLWNADLVVAPSFAFLQTLLSLYGPLPRTKVIPNTRTPSLFNPNAPKQPLIFSAGRLWDEAKNTRLLAQIAPTLKWPTHLAGDPTFPVDSRQLAVGSNSPLPTANCQPPTALHLGHLPPTALRDYLARAAIYVHPALYEPFGLAPLEAALSRCALVLSDLPSLREIWSDTALYIDPANPISLQRALTTLIHNPTLRNAHAARALTRAQAFAPEPHAQAYLSAYAHLLSRRSELPLPLRERAGVRGETQGNQQRPSAEPPLRHSDFVIDSSFGFRHSPLASTPQSSQFPQ